MTLAAFVDETGIHAPSYSDILTELQAAYRAIYGSDIYLGNDSQDGQLLAVFAQAISDVNSAAVAVYNSFSPITAQGAGLSSIVKINNIRRQVPTNSTVDVTLTGQAGTVITNGIVSDANNNKWNLPATVTIGGGGTVAVTATAQVEGNIAAGVATVTKITTPTLGWQSVTNAAIATPGAAVETDAALRVRQAVSTALPSETPLDGIVAAIGNLIGVQEIKPYENDTGSTDGNGIPAHSISIVVIGGDDVEIATTIALKKNPGTGTYGTTTEDVMNSSGLPVAINFYRPTDVPIDVHIAVTALTGYVTSTGDVIKAAIADYISALPIGGGVGEAVEWSKLIFAANNTAFSTTYNVTAVTLRKGAGSFLAADVPIAFNEVSSCIPADITLTVT